MKGDTFVCIFMIDVVSDNKFLVTGRLWYIIIFWRYFKPFPAGSGYMESTGSMQKDSTAI